MDSEIGLPGKSGAKIMSPALIGVPKKWRWVIAFFVSDVGAKFELGHEMPDGDAANGRGDRREAKSKP